MTYLMILQREFDRRRAQNPRYSMRAFARFLTVDSSSLSKILTQKSIPSLELAVKMVKRLQLSETERNPFLISVADAAKWRSLQEIDPSILNVSRSFAQQSVGDLLE